jgi:hypothetical protein
LKKRDRDIPQLGSEYEDLGLCPCGKQIGANGRGGAIIHGIPPCKPFLELEPIQFLVYVRKARGISDN